MPKWNKELLTKDLTAIIVPDSRQAGVSISRLPRFNTKEGAHINMYALPPGAARWYLSHLTFQRRERAREGQRERGQFFTSPRFVDTSRWRATNGNVAGDVDEEERERKYCPRALAARLPR